MYINTSLALCAGKKRGYTEMRVEEDYTFKFDLEQVWYIMQACVREQANVETNIRIMPDRLDDMDFINRCKHDSEQYSKILKHLTGVVKGENG